MPNDMMLAALRNQRATKMDPQPAPAPSRSGDDAGGLAGKISSLESKLDQLLAMMKEYWGMESKEHDMEKPGMKPGMTKENY